MNIFVTDHFDDRNENRYNNVRIQTCVDSTVISPFSSDEISSMYLSLVVLFSIVSALGTISWWNNERIDVTDDHWWYWHTWHSCIFFSFEEQQWKICWQDISRDGSISDFELPKFDRKIISFNDFFSHTAEQWTC